MKCIHCFLCMFRKRWFISHYPILEYTITCGFMLDVRLELHWVLPLCSLMIEIFFWLVLLLITRVPSLHYAVCFIILITCGFRHSIGLFLCMDVLRSPRRSPPLQTLLLCRVVIDACSVQTSSIVYSLVAEVVDRENLWFGMYLTELFGVYDQELQHQQQHERESILTQIDRSRMTLLGKLKEHKGEELLPSLKSRELHPKQIKTRGTRYWMELEMPSDWS